MEYKVLFASLETVCEKIITVMCAPSDLPYGAVAHRMVTCMRQIQEHGRALEPVVGGFIAVYHHYDFDAQTPGNGYRTLVKVRLDVLLLYTLIFVNMTIHNRLKDRKAFLNMLQFYKISSDLPEGWIRSAVLGRLSILFVVM